MNLFLHISNVMTLATIKKQILILFYSGYSDKIYEAVKNFFRRIYLKQKIYFKKKIKSIDGLLKIQSCL